jgi:hypothetical protein
MEISNHTSWNRKIMRREKQICPTIKGFVFCDDTELSTARIDVVPTVQCFFFVLHRLQYHKLLE